VEDHEFNNFIDYNSVYKFPIKDRTAPSIDYLTKIIDFIITLEGTLYIYCKGGHGRSGTVATALYGKINNIGGEGSIYYINKEWHNQRNLRILRPQIQKLGCPQTNKQKKIVIEYLRIAI
jgi:hypothetical protein